MIDMTNTQNDELTQETENPVVANLWSIDRAFKDGQIKAGEVDREQAAFLQKTEMVD